MYNSGFHPLLSSDWLGPNDICGNRLVDTREIAWATFISFWFRTSSCCSYNLWLDSLHFLDGRKLYILDIKFSFPGSLIFFELKSYLASVDKNDENNAVTKNFPSMYYERNLFIPLSRRIVRAKSSNFLCSFEQYLIIFGHLLLNFLFLQYDFNFFIFQE